MSIKSDLQFFYDHEAKKYAETRQKFRYEGEKVLKEIEKIAEQKKKDKKDWKVKILEIGAGSGRFATFLKENFKWEFEYQGCDISSELLKYAHKNNPKMQFEVSDMLTFLEQQPQESADIIVGIASFQHLPTQQERLLLMKYAYRALRYPGILLMTNRACSKRFLQKHRKIFFKSLYHTVTTFWKQNWRDVEIPWTNKGKTYHRYYHLFSLKELKNLALSSSFKLKECGYIDREGTISKNRKNARNSRFIGIKKGVF